MREMDEKMPVNSAIAATEPQPSRSRLNNRTKLIIASILVVIIILLMTSPLIIPYLITGTSPLMPTVACSKGNTSTEWIFTVVAISGGQPLRNDVYVEITNQNGHNNVTRTHLAASLDDGMFTFKANGTGPYLEFDDAFSLKKAGPTDGYGIGSILTIFPDTSTSVYYAKMTVTG